jgi:hypothetical protein
MQGVKGGSGKDSLLIVPSEIVLPVQGFEAGALISIVFSTKSFGMYLL